MFPLLPGNIVLIAGYTGMKKSTYLHHIVNFNLRCGQRVVYCCSKDKPFDVGLEIIAENAHVNVEYIKRGMVTEDDWCKLANSQATSKSENLALIPYNEISHSDNVLSIIENSGAEIVVIDDFNGIILDGSDLVEQFFYQLKNVAVRSGVVVFVIYNINTPTRMDKHPILRDFPSDCYYRLFNIVQLLYRPSLFYDNDYDKDILEVITVKGALKNPYIIKLMVLDNITGVFAIDANEK